MILQITMLRNFGYKIHLNKICLCMQVFRTSRIIWFMKLVKSLEYE